MTSVGTCNIESNFIEHCTYGLVIAPYCDPVNSNSACSTLNNAYYLNTRNVNITCNHIFYCDYGVVGTGDISDQGDINGEWETFFDDTANGTSSTCIYGFLS